jgi:hypothetical protein
MDTTRLRVLDFVRLIGVNLGNALLCARGQLDADSGSRWV